MYNNYNPYQYYQPSIQTPIQSKSSTLQGKQVESVEIVKNIEIPLDGSISYFPLIDNTTIATKQLQNDGTTKIEVFKKAELQEKSYITEKELKKALDKYNLNELDDIKDEIKELKKQLKKKLNDE